MRTGSKLLFITLLLTCTSTIAQPDCSTAEGAKAAQQKIEEALLDIKSDQKSREADVENEIKAKAAVAGWKSGKESQVFMDIMSSPKFAALEKEKQPHIKEIMNIMMSTSSGSGPAEAKAQCEAAKRLSAVIPKIKEINARQYIFMAAEVHAAK